MCAGCSWRHRKPRGICAKAGVSFTLAVPTASACHSSAVRSMRLRREQSRDSRRGWPATSARAASPVPTYMAIAAPVPHGEAAANRVTELPQKRTHAELERGAIKASNLPLLDEPMPPIMGQYSKPHTKAWAAKIGSFDGFVFVTPEYNH